MFGIFKSPKQKNRESTKGIMRSDSEGHNRSKVRRALESKGIKFASQLDNSQYSIQASAAIVRLIANDAGIPVKKGSDEDDDFVAGIFSFVVSNHICYMVGTQFETISSIVVIDLLGLEAASDVNDLADSYNRMTQEGRVIEAIGQNVAKWISTPTDEQFAKLVELYRLCREHTS